MLDRALPFLDSGTLRPGIALVDFVEFSMRLRTPRQPKGKRFAWSSEPLLLAFIIRRDRQIRLVKLGGKIADRACDRKVAVLANPQSREKGWDERLVCWLRDWDPQVGDIAKGLLEAWYPHVGTLPDLIREVLADRRCGCRQCAGCGDGAQAVAVGPSCPSAGRGWGGDYCARVSWPSFPLRPYPVRHRIAT